MLAHVPLAARAGRRPPGRSLFTHRLLDKGLNFITLGNYERFCAAARTRKWLDDHLSFIGPVPAGCTSNKFVFFAAKPSLIDRLFMIGLNFVMPAIGGWLSKEGAHAFV